MPDDSALRKNLIDLLQGGNAHITFDDALNGFPVDKANVRPEGSPHSAWELLEHLRIAQHDIVAFSAGFGPGSGKAPPKDYVELKWPEGYWPASLGPRSPSEWEASVSAVRENLARFVETLRDPKRDLFEPFPWGDGQTLLREALLIADHNAYHLGQLMLVRRMLEAASTQAGSS
jgi:hypothetical protein